MKIILFTHPKFLNSQSMPRFAAMLRDGMISRGHKVEVWSPSPKFYNIAAPAKFKKWLGYIDQYVVFPASARGKLKSLPKDTMFVFADQALGPWIPLVADRPHVIHCHDFLAQQSAAGQIIDNPVGWTGIQYQKYIRKGYLSARNFISVSKKTQADLHDFYGSVPRISEVVYNGLDWQSLNEEKSAMQKWLTAHTGIDCSNGYILHVGGNQWYKNRRGVVEIYTAWRANYDRILPLIMIGAKADERLLNTYNRSEFKSDIHLLTGVDDEMLKRAYAGAEVFLFPSIAEGFGWPIAEAMASGVPVITTNEAPMTEVAGEAAYLIPKRPSSPELLTQWATQGAMKIEEILSLEDTDRANLISRGLENIKRFDARKTLDVIEKIYLTVLKEAR